MSTYIICYCGEIRTILCGYPILPGNNLHEMSTPISWNKLVKSICNLQNFTRKCLHFLSAAKICPGSASSFKNNLGPYFTSAADRSLD